ncbi:EAL domain-containing protein [Planctellipticum variicoloris]|uniref:EAL domain-containing protein n=1 Tax=Planctellipticum variicoloris TaxID=3064265 RepID=UPI002BCB927B|nr:EAL domain-containing protein [Planctomycetaceae bacterium SH412]HTN00554.1 EAL domain-containing protein [Planctomycetaceae bacterium]
MTATSHSAEPTPRTPADESRRESWTGEGDAVSVLACINAALSELRDRLPDDLLANLQDVARSASAVQARSSLQSSGLVASQADAIVRSAEMIEELERTRCELERAHQTAEQTAQDTELLANTIFERTCSALFVLKERACIACNRNALRLFGVSRDEVIGQYPGFLFTADPRGEDAPGAIFGYEAAMLHGHFCEESIRRRKNGEVFWCEITLSAFRVRGQDHLLAVVKDITRRKQVEEQLRLFAGVFDNIQEGVAILDRRGIIREANPAFERVSGRPPEEITDRPLQEVVNWSFEDLPRVLESVIAGEPWAGRMRIGDPCRRPKSFLVSFSPSLDARGDGSVIALFSDVTRIERTQRRLRRQVLHDPLTGLPNRRYCREQIQCLIQHSADAGSAFAVCFLDLDDFKHVNDSLGHKAGDQLLQIVARRLKKAVSQGVFVARFGGDEFAILIPDIDPLRIRIAEVADAVLKSLRRPFRLAGTQAFVGISMGVTIYPTHAGNVDTLLQNADVAMYSAKDSGKNQVCIFSDDLRAVAEDRHHTQSALRRALGDNQISIEYQPQVWTTTGRLAGCEALARWRNSAGQIISPTKFIPIAEQTGLITALGDFVLATTCRQAVAWRLAGCLPDRVAINLSPRQLRHPRFVERMEEILAETGVRPEWLELEITENAVMEDVQQSMRVMDRLAAMGIRLAIDDFGTGYSSLSYLKSFNIHCLKIDKSFVSDLPDDESALAIARSIVSLAKGRGLSVVAEGVETSPQYECLMEMGCDLIQGFIVSQPLTPAAFEAWSKDQPFSGALRFPVGNSSPFSFS